MNDYKMNAEQIKEATQLLYGEHAEPIIHAIETRENWKAIHRRFQELKEQYPYKECVRRLIDEFHASESLVKKSIHKQFPDGS